MLSSKANPPNQIRMPNNADKGPAPRQPTELDRRESAGDDQSQPRRCQDAQQRHAKCQPAADDQIEAPHRMRQDQIERAVFFIADDKPAADEDGKHAQDQRQHREEARVQKSGGLKTRSMPPTNSMISAGSVSSSCSSWPRICNAASNNDATSSASAASANPQPMICPRNRSSCSEKWCSCLLRVVRQKDFFQRRPLGVHFDHRISRQCLDELIHVTGDIQQDAGCHHSDRSA